MNLKLTDEELAFRDELRTFFTTEFPAEIREKVAAGRHLDRDEVVRSQQILNAKGLAVPNWPVEWGGKDWTPVQRNIWLNEMQLVTLAWLAMGSIGEDHPDPAAVTSLRARVIEQYRHPFDQILTSPEARAMLGELDTTFAIIELLGPIVFARLTGLRSIDHDDCTRLVDNFLTAHRTPTPADTAIDIATP
ncbi:acyl-CoA dehydrogenase family protein [Rhodococcus sp. YH1]|uniref:acyl-CoA dehydrogenase family protein n=1 Tax=Rhodococcus sp. YH1 TaxID=89066 RepID=UPI00138741E2|nr:hypothetical protein [Rhodococcus sp. YH1]